MNKFDCPLCDDTFRSIDGLYAHIEEDHDDVTDGMTPQQYLYYRKTGKQHGNCVVCKKETKWNPSTGKYHRFCDNPKCKEKYREMFKKRMIGKYGKTTLLTDPDQQRKMLANREITKKNQYQWTDGTYKTCTGSYERDFVQYLDVFWNFDSSDVFCPSPHTYYYKYNGETKFYIPDIYIASLNLEIEIKDGGNNPNTHPKIVAVDKVKERLKDEVMTSVKGVNYLKVTNKEYGIFIKYLNDQKIEYAKKDKSDVLMESVFDAESIPSNTVTESCKDLKSTSESYDIIDATNPEVLTESIVMDDVAPVYVILIEGQNDISKVIKLATNSKFSHACIAFDPSLNNMYTYLQPGFSIENLQGLLDNKMAVYAFFVKRPALEIMKSQVEKFKDNVSATSYNTLKAIKSVMPFGKDTSRESLNQICSSFVDNILRVAGIKITHNERVVTPASIEREFGKKDMENKIFLLHYGYGKEYKPKFINRVINKIKKSPVSVMEDASAQYTASLIDNGTNMTNNVYRYLKHLCLFKDLNKTDKLNDLIGSRTYDNIFLGTDYHFYKHGVLQTDIIRMQQKAVKPTDIFIFLGDISHKEYSNFNNIRNICQQLSGIKIMIKGNHDVFSDEFYNSCGFTIVTDVASWNDIIFTHVPIDMDTDGAGFKLNIHGHIHGAKMYHHVTPDGHLDVYPLSSAKGAVSLHELLDYYPKYQEETIYCFNKD